MKPRLAKTLAAVAEGMADRAALAAHTGWSEEDAGRALHNARQHGYLVATARAGRLSVFELTDEGRAKLAALSGDGIAPAEGALDVRALEMLQKAPNGLNSEALAQALGVSIAEVDYALADHVQARRLVACVVRRQINGELVQMFQYRLSSGSAGGAAARYDWHAQKAVTWGNREQPAQAPAETAAEVLDAPAAAHTAAAVPFVGELDIDAVDRARAAAEGQPEPGEFICAMHSNGVFDIESYGRRLRLPLEHTRRLVHYLDRVLGAELVDAAEGVRA